MQDNEKGGSIDINNNQSIFNKEEALSSAYALTIETINLCRQQVKEGKPTAALITGAVKSMLDIVKYNDSQNIDNSSIETSFELIIDELDEDDDDE